MDRYYKCNNCLNKMEEYELKTVHTTYESYYGAYSAGGMIRTPLELTICPYCGFEEFLEGINEDEYNEE